MCGHAGDEGCRGGSESLWPVGAHEVVVPADATGGNDDGLRTEKDLEALTKRRVDLVDTLLKGKEAELLEI